MNPSPSTPSGVLHFLGTSGRACAWMNPHLTGAVRVASSSPFGAFSDPRKLLSRCYHGSLCAEPRATGSAGGGGERSAFWALDLGPLHRLACNHYTLRQNDSSEFPRHWALQARRVGRLRWQAEPEAATLCGADRLWGTLRCTRFGSVSCTLALLHCDRS